ncbi:hypothetical protein D0867_06313 [Hortaea werneckii]|uniref:Heterokaryon incompatibility domain-containing protein n=1 Tax=Hortaea werneckii TaxID=91943 RepID=A0A3M6ZP34_HORWE|nr:hypothetical protein KC334_g2164 [Hortaea werneckii]KAI6985347.1 hypothetical protein KC355_g10662 [Hortaea werneckii]RMY17044.1 hypothetical protein D0867_06313 [Hortaea werneckii]
MAERSKSTYAPLHGGDWFRLLQLDPGVGNDPVLCSLHICRLSNAPPFEAISYVWGDSTDTVALTCDGKSKCVTVNLELALKRFRHASDTRTVWADAICIDQSNTAEKNHQVGMMGDVYRQAEQVLVWLGPDPDCCARPIFGLVQGLTAYYADGETKHGSVDLVPVPGPDEPFLKHARWDLLDRLLELPWFHRVWVLQEVGLARTAMVAWGSSEILFASIIEFVTLVNQQTWVPVNLELGRIIDTFFLLWATYDTEVSWKNERPRIRGFASLPVNKTRCEFFNVLLVTLHYQATDPRDKIYASLGHPSAQTKADQGTIVSPDYGRSLIRVHFELACSLMTGDRRLLALSAVEHIDSADVDSCIISWLPRWISGDTRIIAPFKGIQRWFDASRRRKTVERQLIQPNPEYDDEELVSARLQVAGIIFDRVVAFSSVIDRNEVRNRDASEQWVNPVDASLCVCDPSDKHAIEAVSLCLVCGMGGTGTSAAEGDLETHMANFYSYRKNGYVHEDQRKAETFEHRVKEPGNGNWYARFLSSFAHNRRTFRTEHDRYGLGPQALMLGDVCCIVLGSDVPFILRPVGSQGDYRLVGECYVHGVMRGEIVDMVANSTLMLEAVSLF